MDLRRPREPETQSSRPELDEEMIFAMSQKDIIPYPGAAEDYSSFIMAQYFHHRQGQYSYEEDQNTSSSSSEDPKNNNNIRSHNINDDEYRDRVDAIDPETAGRVLMNKVVHAAGEQVKWAKKILDVMYDPAELLHCTAEQEAEKAAKKGVPKANFVNSKMRKTFDKLRDIGMMERLEKDDPRLRDGEDENMVASAVMFMVEKLGTECTIERNGVKLTVPRLRLIADARRANAKLRNNLSYNIFTLDALFQTVSNVFQRTERSTKKKWYCINADLRHWFHQIPLPEHLRNLFQFRFESGEVYRACLLPMGWFLSPPIAQAITWTLALSSPKRGCVPGISRAQHLPEMPPWLEFDKNAGGIFVLQDNLFIITDDESLAKQWSAHLTERAKFFNAEFKGEGPVVVEISEENGKSVEFNGIEIFYGKWRTAHRQDRENAFFGDGPYRFTHRKISTLLGEILWDLRVRRIAGIEDENLIKLFSINSPSSKEKWDSINEAFTQENYELLKNELEITRQHQFVDYGAEWHPEKKNTQVYAVDASLGENKAKEVLQATIAVVSFKFGDGVTIWKWKNEHKPHVYIGEAELEAIVWAVEDAMKFDPLVSMIIIATDSLCAKGWVERMYSDRPFAQKLLKYLWNLIKPRGIRLCCIYIRTDHNMADVPSRIKVPDTRCNRMENWTTGLEPLDVEAVTMRLKSTELLLRGTNTEVVKRANTSGRIVVKIPRQESELKKKEDVKVQQD